MIKKIALTVSLMSIAAGALAVDAETGIYLGALGGWAQSSTPNNDMVKTLTGVKPTNADRQHISYGGNLGFDWAFNSNWMAGLEGGYLYFEKVTYKYSDSSNTELTSDGFQVMLTGTYLDDSGFNGFAKLGAVDETSKVSGRPFLVGGSEKAWLPAAALGVGYMPFQNFNVALEDEYVFGDNWTSESTNKPLKQNVIMLGISYKIGI